MSGNIGHMSTPGLGQTYSTPPAGCGRVLSIPCGPDARRENYTMSARHAGKIVVISGGASGIGQAIVRRLAEEGARVAIADARLQAASATCSRARCQMGWRSPTTATF